MWPFGYFKKKREKEEQMRRREEENAHLQKLEQERIVRERERRLEENRKKEEQRKVEIENRNSFYPFTFKSDCHQRYESNIPVQGLQQCGRTVSVISNETYSENKRNGRISRFPNRSTNSIWVARD